MIYVLHQTDPTLIGVTLCMYMGVSKNRGKNPKMDGENTGKPYKNLSDLGGNPPNPYFWVQHPYTNNPVTSAVLQLVQNSIPFPIIIFNRMIEIQNANHSLHSCASKRGGKRSHRGTHLDVPLEVRING